MSLLTEIAGAVAGLEAEKHLDPNSGLLKEGLAALAGFVGVEKIEEHLAEKEQAQEVGQATNSAT